MTRPAGPEQLLEHFGRIDIYLFDQLLRGRITPHMRVLDAGCGAGRNSVYLMRSGADVFGIDTDPSQIDRIVTMKNQVAPALPASNFTVGRLTKLPFQDDHFDAVICSAVLHFASDEREFEAMVAEMWRVLRTPGVFFARLASSIGIESRVVHHGDRRHRLPDGTDRFLVDEQYLLRLSEAIGATLLDPIKTTNVQNLRAMTTWVLEKRANR